MTLRIMDWLLLPSMAAFCRKLRHSLLAGLPLESSLIVFISDTKHTEFRRRLSRLLDRLRDGTGFSTAFSELAPGVLPLQFEPDTPISDLPRFLDYCATYLERRQAALSALGKRLTYPLILLFSVVGMMGFFFGTLLPNYLVFFRELGLTPPLFMRALMGIRTILPGCLFLLLVLSGIGMYWGRSSSVWAKRSYTHAIWLLSVMLSSGFSLKAAIQSVRIHDAFQNDLLVSGDFCTCLVRHVPLSDYQRELLLASRHTGRLADVLMAIAEDQYVQSDATFQRIVSAVQPSLLVFIGVVVFGFVYMTFVPILQGMSRM